MVSLNIYPYICFICRPLIKPCLVLTILLLPALSQAQGPMVGQPITGTSNIDQFNVLWDSPSGNAAASMPCGGGDIGLNVWVEDGDLLFYVARSGTFDENNSLLKLGRIRIRLNSSPLKDADFQQELVLRDGSVVISGRSGNTIVKIRVWVDVMRPVIHVDIDGSHPLQTEAIYESWRTADRIITVHPAPVASSPVPAGTPLVPPAAAAAPPDQDWVQIGEVRHPPHGHQHPAAARLLGGHGL